MLYIKYSHAVWMILMLYDTDIDEFTMIFTLYDTDIDGFIAIVEVADEYHAL